MSINSPLPEPKNKRPRHGVINLIQMDRTERIEE